MLAGVDPSLPFTLSSWPQALAFVLFPARLATAALGVMGLLAACRRLRDRFGSSASIFREAVTDGWLACAPPKLAAQFLKR